MKLISSPIFEIGKQKQVLTKIGNYNKLNMQYCPDNLGILSEFGLLWNASRD